MGEVELAASLGVGVLVSRYPSGTLIHPSRDVPVGTVRERDVSPDPRGGLEALTHGTRRLYARGCPCGPCTTAHTRYGKRRLYREVAYPTSLGVPAAPVAAHIADLRRTMSLTAIAAAAGVTHSTLLRMDRQKKVNARTARAVLAVQHGHSTGQHYIDATGTARRLRALVATGYTAAELANRAGIKRENLSMIVSGERTTIWATTANTIRDLYAALAMTPAPIPPDRIGRTHRTRAIRRAARAGWAPPLAWDDDTIDDPDARPAPAYQPSHRVDLDEAERLLQWGVTPDAVAARLGTERRTLARAAYRHDRPDLGRTLDQKPARRAAA